MARPQLTAKEALQHHQNLIYRRALEKLQSEQPLDDDELTEVKRRESEEKEAKSKVGVEPRGRGRQTKLTRELIVKIRAHIAEGNTVKNACTMARISESAFYRWLETDDVRQPLFAELREAIKEAQAECEARMVRDLQKHMRTNWQAICWWLERRNPDVYGRKDFIRAEHSGPNGTPLPVQSQIVVYMPDNGRSVQTSDIPKLGNGS